MTLIRPEVWALLATGVVAATGPILSKKRSVRRPYVAEVLLAVAFPLTLAFDDYRVRILVHGSNGAFDAVRVVTLAVSTYAIGSALLAAVFAKRVAHPALWIALLLAACAVGLGAAFVSTL